MAINTNDPRVSKEGRRILIDGIPVRMWLKNRNISLATFYYSCGKGMSVSEIENKYRNHNHPPLKEHIVQYKGKEWTISELYHDLCRKDISQCALRKRILNYKWDIDRALSEPPRKKCGYEVTYKGKVYASVTDLCLKLGINPAHVGKSVSYGFSLEEAIERASNVGLITLMYKGNEICIMDLVGHPDNIHKLSYGIIYRRIFYSGHNPEEALSYPVTDIRNNKFEYKGRKYTSKMDFCRKNNLDYGSYTKLLGLDPDTPEFIELIDKLVASK